MKHKYVRHEITPLVPLSVGGMIVLMEDEDAPVQMAEGCDLCNMEVSTALANPECQGVPVE